MEILKSVVFDHKIIRIVGTQFDALIIADDIAEILGKKYINGIMERYDENEISSYVIHIDDKEVRIRCLTFLGLTRMMFRTQKPIVKQLGDILYDAIKDIEKGL